MEKTNMNNSTTTSDQNMKGTPRDLKNQNQQKDQAEQDSKKNDSNTAQGQPSQIGAGPTGKSRG